MRSRYVVAYQSADHVFKASHHASKSGALVGVGVGMLGRMCRYTGGGGKSDIQPIASWTQIRLGTLGTQATTRLAAGTGGSREPPVPAGLT